MELRKVYEKFAVAITSLVQFARAQLGAFGVPSFLNINSVSGIFFIYLSSREISVSNAIESSTIGFIVLRYNML